MTEFSNNIFLVILITAIATYSSRLLGFLSSKNMDIGSNFFKWFNCVAYAILASLTARMIIFPAGVLEEVELWIRLTVIIISIIVFFISKKNLVYPTVLSAILLSLLSNYL
jgi:branched-subunit amino acid transport protein